MANDETKQPEEAKPQAAGGPVDGTVPPTGIPIEIFRQVVPVPTPQAAEEIRAALAAHEEDACVKNKVGEGWVYVRTRAFVDLKKAAEAQQTKKEEASDVSKESADGPTAEPVVPGNADDNAGERDKQPEPPAAE